MVVSEFIFDTQTHTHMPYTRLIFIFISLMYGYNVYVA